MSTNPFPIPIGTSDPVDLCSGLPLLPVFGSARAGVSASSRSYKLFDIPVLIAITRLKVSAYAGYGFGICGPAIAFLSQNVDVNRANSDGKGQLTLTFNEGLLMEAGAFVGAYVSAGLTLTLQVYLPKPWYKFWAFTWQNAFTIDEDFKVDLLKLLFALIKYLLSRSSKTSFKKDPQNRLKAAEPYVETFSLDDTAGSLTGVKPDLTATPEVTAPLNLANYVPKLKAINHSLAKIGGEISVGPTVHFQYPVTFNFSKFTVVGGLQGADSADYGDVQYVNGNQVSASGSTQFNTGVKPGRITSHVTTQTRLLKVALSIHFRVTVAKYFNLGVNTPSLDLTYLLFRVQGPNFPEVNGSVSTNVADGCVLTPNMTLTFERSNGSGTSFLTGEPVKGIVTLTEYRSSSPATVDLKIEPRVEGFPGSVTIDAGSQSAAFYFSLPNQCLATGNPNDPSETAPPGPLSPLQSYLVHATLASPPNNPCSDYEVEVPLNIENRFLRCTRNFPSTRGPAPPWDPAAGAAINADPTLEPKGVNRTAQLSCSFPYLDGEPTQTVPVMFTLLDENRQPYADSHLTIEVNGEIVRLNPSATIRVTLERRVGTNSFVLAWTSAGRSTGYSNRFYLILNAGCQYGQTEFWLDVWNWS